MTERQPRIAIVVPCYNEEDALRHTMPVLLEILGRLSDKRTISPDSYILCVDDGSRDATWSIIKELHADDTRVRGISLAHNRGHQYALLAGLMTAREQSDAVISIDADLQDDPEAVTGMIGHYLNGADIVYGVRKSRRTDTWFKRNSARWFYRLQQSMGLQTVYDHADYRLMSRRALEILAEYGEHNLFLRGIIPQIGLRTAVVEYDRANRVAGESKYPLSKMLSFSIDGITSFSAKPLRMIFITGFALLALTVGVTLYVLVSHFVGRTVGGWTSIMLSLWLLGSLILMAIGIVGEYVGKIFTEVKNRPRYDIEAKIGF